MNAITSTITKASREWSNRPADERFTDLDQIQAHFDNIKANSRSAVVSSRALKVVPKTRDEIHGIEIFGANGVGYEPSHWAFGQLANLSGAPAGYLRQLPAPLAADNINYGLRYLREVEDVGVLISKTDKNRFNAATGPAYGRVWNADVIAAIRARFGNGTGTDGSDWKVPGEFGKAVTVTKANTTLYASDRDCFVFLADEKNRIEIGDRRDGKPGTLARGFFVWNSEVGSATLGVATFLFDYVCCNRIVWGAKEYAEIKIRHTSGAPDRFVEEVAPALEAYAKSSTGGIVKAIADARAARLDDVSDFLAERFGKRIGALVALQHVEEEGRPIETVWDAVTGATAYARRIPHQDNRVEFERTAGKLLDLVAA